MKKLIALILAVGLLLTGCGGASRDLMKGVKPSNEGGLIAVSDPLSDGFDPETDEI